ncbi:MAG TPA: GGDEF domain-containing protein, partial [Streptosporangiaceae bacterium]|nr:GGDEF domain-containing protein [Streptosporangiaceae bacterium]
GLAGFAAGRTSWLGADLLTYALLLAGGVISVATTPRSAYVDGRLSMDFIPVWVLPVAVILPPVYALSMPYPLYAVTQWRVHRGPIHRKVFSASSIALGYGAASLVFHSLPAGIAGPHIGHGLHALTWAFGAAVCEALVARWHNLALMAAIKLSDPKVKVLRLALSRESLIANLAESDLGLLISCVVATSPWLSVFAVPMIVLARRFMMHSQLVAQTRVDAKTGLLNSSAWERDANAEIQRAQRMGSALSLVLVDIDHFKRVNDTYGHLVGDVVLRAVTDAIRAQLRAYDLAGRFGGEEFVVLLPNAREADAVSIAERLRLHVAGMAIPVTTEAGDSGAQPPRPQDVRLTISIGVAAMDDSRQMLGDLMAAADTALYQAKQSGRNRTRVMPAISPAAPQVTPVLSPDGAASVGR